MTGRSTIRSLNSLADQLGMPKIDMPEEKLNALVAANSRIKIIMEFMEYLNNNGVYLSRSDGAHTLSDAEVNETILAHVGVSKEDAEIAAKYVVDVINRLQG